MTLYGDRVPWRLVSVGALQKAYDEAPYDLLFLDQELHPSRDRKHAGERHRRRGWCSRANLRHPAPAAQNLDACGGSAPGAVDAGPWTPLIASMMSKASIAAVAVAAGIGTASQGVTDSAASYGRADEAAQTNLGPGAR